MRFVILMALRSSDVVSSGRISATRRSSLSSWTRTGSSSRLREPCTTTRRQFSSYMCLTLAQSLLRTAVARRTTAVASSSASLRTAEECRTVSQSRAHVPTATRWMRRLRPNASVSSVITQLYGTSMKRQQSYSENETEPSKSRCDETTHFECRRNHNCVDRSVLCDGDDDCGDGSDEDGSEGGACRMFCRSYIVIHLLLNGPGIPIPL